MHSGGWTLKFLKDPKSIVASVVFVIAFLTYWSTVAPTTSFWDCGEFIACSYIMGIPHPPGAPLYILIGRIFSMLPIATDIGLRVNMTSVLLSSFSAMFTFLIIVRLLEMWQGKADTVQQRILHYGSGVIGALAFAFSDSQWFNSVEAEVYAGSLFFTAIVIWLILRWAERDNDPMSDKYILLIAYLIGLALGVHLLNLLALPTIAMIMYFHKRQKITVDSFFIFAGMAALAFVAVYPGVVKGIPQLILRFSFFSVGLVVLGIVFLIRAAIKAHNREVALALMSLFLVFMGYSTYSAIYIRSALNPAIDENDPDTPQRFVSYLNREQYGDWSITKRRADLWDYQIKKMYIRYFGWQFIGKGDTIGPDGLISETVAFRGLLGLPFLLGLLGMIHHFYKDWRRASSILVLFIMTGLAIIIYLNQENPQPRERDYAYTGSFFAFALWIGIGASAVLEFARDALKNRQKLVQPVMTAVTVVLLLAVPGTMFAFNYHDHSRKGNYVAYDYSYNILQSCEPNAIIFTNGDNDTFPLWFLQTVYGIRRDVRIINLSLLNTGWYIKQLRDQEPKVPISLSDDEIDKIAPMPWKAQKIKISVMPELYNDWVSKIQQIDPSYKADSKPEMVFELKPTLYGQGIRVQDIMIIHILSENKFKKPVYFAVTVADNNKIGLQGYMRMEGLAFRVLPVKAGRRIVDPEILRTNLFENYHFRNLNDPKVHYNDNIIALLGNYRSAFLTLAQYYLYNDKTDEALDVLDKMNAWMPEEIIPPTDRSLSLLIGQLYATAGKPGELRKRLDRFLQNEEVSPSQKAQFIPWYSRMAKNPAAAESLAKAIIAADPTATQAYGFLVDRYRREKRYSEGIALLQNWLGADPNSAIAKSYLGQFQSFAQSDSGSAADSTRSK